MIPPSPPPALPPGIGIGMPHAAATTGQPEPAAALAAAVLDLVEAGVPLPFHGWGSLRFATSGQHTSADAAGPHGRGAGQSHCRRVAGRAVRRPRAGARSRRRTRDRGRGTRRRKRVLAQDRDLGRTFSSRSANPPNATAIVVERRVRCSRRRARGAPPRRRRAGRTACARSATISSVPSSSMLTISERMTSSVTRPPALRMMCASPVRRPSVSSTSRRASMHAMMASLDSGAAVSADRSNDSV